MLRGLVSLSLLAVPLGCVVTYSDEFPAGLDDVPDIGDTDELVFERELSWWIAPTNQRISLWRRDDDSYVLLRRRWQGAEVYGWFEATLTDEGRGRLGNALAVADASMTAPAPGNLACTYVDALHSTIYVDDQRVEYLAGCPPEGLVELADLYEDLVELMLVCPFDGAWYSDPLPLGPLDCDVFEP